MKAQALAMAIVMAFSCLVSGGGTLREKCGNEFTKVTACLTFATGKASIPTKECCSSVTEIKDTDPVCLCYIIQQFYNSSDDQLKNLGVVESRLFELPSACKVTGGNVTDCPKLLHLPPNSPAAAIFTNTSASASSTPVTTPSSLSPTTVDTSNGLKQVSPSTLAMALALGVGGHLLQFSAFP